MTEQKKGTLEVDIDIEMLLSYICPDCKTGNTVRAKGFASGVTSMTTPCASCKAPIRANFPELIRG